MLRERPSAKAGAALEDFIGGFGPFKGLGILVADLDEFPDRLFQGDGAAVGAALDLTSGKEGEPPFPPD